VPVFTTGDGTVLAYRLRAELERRRPSQVYVIGVAGGLDPSLRAGELLSFDRVMDASGRESGAPRPPRRRCRRGVGVSARAIVADAEAKRRLWHDLGSPPAAVVDLESRIYADICAELDVPLTFFKVVSDTAGESVPSAVLDAVGRDGSVSQLGVALRALVSPTQIPALARFGRRVAEAAERLADAVESEL
jgi:adenosylhomocysteine nucleosidase